MDPRLYDLQAALDASFAMAQGGNEGTSGSERVVVDVAYAGAMPLASTSRNDQAISAVATTTSTVPDDMELAIKASIASYEEEKAREAGHFWPLFNSPIREWRKSTAPPMIECPLCFEEYPSNEIKYFVCGHWICKHECLDGFIKAQKPFCHDCKTPVHVSFKVSVTKRSIKTFEDERAQREMEDRKRSAEEANLNENYDSDTDTVENDPEVEIVKKRTVTTTKTVQILDEVTVFRSNMTPYQAPASSFASQHSTSLSSAATSVPSNNYHADQGIFSTVYAPQIATNTRPIPFVAAPAPVIDPTATVSAQDDDPFAIFSLLPPIQARNTHAPHVAPAIEPPIDLDNSLFISRVLREIEEATDNSEQNK